MKILASDFDKTLYIDEEDKLNKNIESIRNFITNGHVLMHHFQGRKKTGQVVIQKPEIPTASCLL